MDDTDDLDDRMADAGSADTDRKQSPKIAFDFMSRGEEISTSIDSTQDADREANREDQEEDEDWAGGASSPSVIVVQDAFVETGNDDFDTSTRTKDEGEDAPGSSSPEREAREGLRSNNDPAKGTISTRIEIPIPSMPEEQRLEYEDITSDVIESVMREQFTDAGQLCYLVEFVDGREEVLEFDDLANYPSGQAALENFYETNGAKQSKRKHTKMDAEDYRDDLDELNDYSTAESTDGEDSEPVAKRPRTIRVHSRRATPFGRETSHRSSRTPATPSDAGGASSSVKDVQPRRSLRARKPTLSHYADDKDELQDDQDNTFDPDAHTPIVQSDLPGPKRGQRKLRRLKPRQSLVQMSQRGSPDSDIEFEAPRRSARSTRNQVVMRDDEQLDDESFYRMDDKPTEAPKVISIKEVFQPINSNSEFALVHIDSCHTCGGSKQRGQLIYCQGCSLTFHKNCLGFRSAREHMVTKVGEQDFVLQCKYCIGLYKKKDSSAPSYDMCQDCNDVGKACKSFSERKTARQEEKLREQNNGVDPVTSVSPDLLNNHELVLFRCVKCHRGWHIEHLPPTGGDSVSTDVRSERLKGYSIDWQCNECHSMKHRIHRLVAWRPVEDSSLAASSQSKTLSSQDFDEDSKEYLVKWESTSYFHCTWKPSAWVFGVAVAAMRTSFAKRDAERSLMSPTKQDAIPEEYLMPDVILNLKMDKSVPRLKSKADELKHISHIRRIFVKFQGLGYDEAVWDSPPTESDGKDIYNAFLEAIYDFLEGKYFKSESNARIRDRLRKYKDSPFEGVDQQPADLQRGKLMAYQIEGLNWLLKNYHRGRSVVLADEMGLGKTVQVISLVCSLIRDEPKCWPFLIVVPNATCPNWRREFKQWTPDLRVVTYHGGKVSQELAYKYELFPHGTNDMKAHVVIMSYDSAADPQTKTLFRGIQWQGLVVDEGQRLKNDQNLLYGALHSMKIPFRLLLTGTPLQNNKRELFNLLQFIDTSQDAARLDEEFEVLDKETLPKLHDRIRPYFLRRTKAGVLKFLPPMAQIILPVTMTVLQEKLCKSIMAKNPQLIQAIFANNKMNKKERGSLNNILMQLRKCLCHPFIYSEAIEERHHDQIVLHQNLIEASAKLVLLQVMLPKLKERGHRVLIFSQFLQQLDIIEDFLIGVGYGYRRLDGQISSLEKQRRIDAFNAPDSELFAFLLSTRAGGVGINLATADTVIIMDPDFNPHQDIQALSRAHRIGQKNKVLCFQLVTKNSVEERIMQIGRKKMALDHALIESMDDNDLEGDDLESILKHGAQALFDEDYQKDAIHYDAASVDKLLDRSEVEQTETNEDGSAETQFNYAKVWANDKSGFDDGLGLAEDEAPEPIGSSVWDQIIAQREEEARKEAEATREVLGRGSRRRTAVGSYKHTGSNAAIIAPDAADGGSSESSEYSGAESADESEDEGLASAKDGQDLANAAFEAEALRNKNEKTRLTGLLNPNGEEKTYGKPRGPGGHTSDERPKRGRKKKTEGGQHAGENSHEASEVQFPGATGYSQSNTSSHAANQQVNAASRNQMPLHSYLQNPRHGDTANNQGSPATSISYITSEASLRIALDLLNRTKTGSKYQEHHRRQKAELLRKIQELSVLNSKHKG